jgi:predicted dehydrogenase
VVVTTADTQEDELVAGGSPSTSETWGVETASDLDRIFSPSGSAPVSLARGAWDRYYPAFARAVRGDGPSPVDADDAVATADVLEAARISAAAHETVRPGPGR